MSDQVDRKWTDDELRAAVAAYLNMQGALQKGVKVSKKDYYEDLSKRFNRSPGAFEYRMQNISYVLSKMGRIWINGLTPARNVGTNTGEKIELLIAELEGRKTVPRVAFEMQVSERREKPQTAPPSGNPNPRTTSGETTRFERDAAVITWVLKAANGACECCRSPAPFANIEGHPFLEVHHVRHLANAGSDTISNAVALCPNCHRELHYGARAPILVEHLYNSITRLIRE